MQYSTWVIAQSLISSATHQQPFSSPISPINSPAEVNNQYQNQMSIEQYTSKQPQISDLYSRSLIRANHLRTKYDSDQKIQQNSALKIGDKSKSSVSLYYKFVKQDYAIPRTEKVLKMHSTTEKRALQNCQGEQNSKTQKLIQADPTINNTDPSLQDQQKKHQFKDKTNRELGRSQNFEGRKSSNEPLLRQLEEKASKQLEKINELRQDSATWTRLIQKLKKDSENKSDLIDKYKHEAAVIRQGTKQLKYQYQLEIEYLHNQLSQRQKEIESYRGKLDSMTKKKELLQQNMTDLRLQLEDAYRMLDHERRMNRSHRRLE